jgi:hypothetical protein
MGYRYPQLRPWNSWLGEPRPKRLEFVGSQFAEKPGPKRLEANPHNLHAQNSTNVLQKEGEEGDMQAWHTFWLRFFPQIDFPQKHLPQAVHTVKRKLVGVSSRPQVLHTFSTSSTCLSTSAASPTAPAVPSAPCTPEQGNATGIE